MVRLDHVSSALGYKFLSQELTRFRMKIVDENRSIRAIEEKVAYGLIEELIFAAHNELKLIRIMKQWKPWDYLFNDDEDKEEMQHLLNLRPDHPFTAKYESFENLRNIRPGRKATAAIHPEEAN